jgi:REP element-mobilizing transposase RayT
MNEHLVNIKSRRLPHWRVENGTYFVTFRLADSLPADVAKSLAEFAQNVRDPEERRKLMERADRYLETGIGECILRRPDCAQIVAESLSHFDGERYRLGKWTVMPNHVHSVMQPVDGWTLDRVVGDIRSYTAHEINKRLGRKGRLWSPEPYDSWIRDERELAKASDYVVNNPVKAGLVDWPWVGEGESAEALLRGAKKTNSLIVKK